MTALPERPPRRIAFSGVANFRDLGGYATSTGGETRWGMLFRSDSLHGLTTEDLVRYDGLGLRASYDLRRDHERETWAPQRPSWHLAVPTHAVAETDPGTLRERADGERWLFDAYRRMLRDAGPILGQLFTRLTAPNGAPAVFFCRGGKDRTGLAAALLLSCLGVDREIVLDDYELTATYRGVEGVPDVIDEFVGHGFTRAAAEGLVSTPRWAMAEALELLDDRYGGIESYLLGPAAMTAEAIEQLRGRFVA